MTASSPQHLRTLGIPVIEVAGFDADDPDSYEATVGRIADFAVAHGCTVALGNTALAFPGIDAAQRLGLSAAWVIHESFSFDELWLELYGGWSTTTSCTARSARSDVPRGSCSSPRRPRSSTKA